MLEREFKVSEVRAEITIKGGNIGLTSSFKKLFYKSFKNDIIIMLMLVSTLSG